MQSSNVLTQPQTAADKSLSASEHAYVLIREKISEGILVSGQRLKETELVELCAVSRTPIREALRRLETEGIVSITPNSGAAVTLWAPAELADLFVVRANIEGMAAAHAAQRRTAKHVEALSSLAARFDALAKTGVSEESRGKIAQANSDFHRAVLDASQSRAMQVAASQVMDIPIMLRTFRKYSAEDLARSSEQHFEIAAAIEAQDANWAEAVMRAHIHAGYQALVKSAHLQSSEQA